MFCLQGIWSFCQSNMVEEHSDSSEENRKNKDGKFSKCTVSKNLCQINMDGTKQVKTNMEKHREENASTIGTDRTKEQANKKSISSLNDIHV